MMPFGELDRRRDFLFETLGREGKIFVRPDSPLKLFTGQTASRESFSEDLEFMGFYEFPERSMVAVSSPKSILAEWRFVVADGIVVAGSQYKAGDEFDSQATYDQAAFDLAQTIASQGYQPDPAWILDVCKTSDDKFHLLEIGGFSFSDLYACDKHDVVKAVSKVAKITWELS